jgi:two-component system phosphate regulon sensor histidine kinase PhoR
VLLVDDRERILLVNKALQRLFAISSDVAEKTTLEVIRNVDLEEAIQEVLRHGIQKNFEITLPVSGEKTFEVNVSGIPSASMEMKGAIAVFHDITRLKELERARKDFVANVSHELRTPLAAMKGYAETLLEGAWREEVALSFIQVIQRHTDRLTKIVEDLLTLSRIEARGFKMESEQTPISDLIDDVFDVVKESASKKKITLLKGDLAPTLLLRADPKHLEQDLINLLDNGIKYTPEDGTLEISVTEREDEFLFAIKDNGIGIPKEDLPRIFERFYRVDKGRSKELGGTGLGLSIVKHIVQAHHGRVWAESQLGKGSTFYFTLPKAPQGQ